METTDEREARLKKAQEDFLAKRCKQSGIVPVPQGMDGDINRNKAERDVDAQIEAVKQLQSDN